MALLPNLSIGAYPNLAAVAVTEITGGSEAPTMPASNLKLPDTHNSGARLLSVYPHEAWFAVDYTKATAVQTLALVQPKLYPGDRWRIVGVESGDLPAVRSETLPPTAIEASVNVTANPLPDIDEHPSAGDGLPCSAANDTLPWSIRLSFGNPSDTLATGADWQCFALRVSAAQQPGSAADYPRVTCSLYEGGVLRRNLGAKTIVFDAGWHGLLFPWDAADLQTPDGSAVEVLLEFTGAPGESKAFLDAVSWEVMHADDINPAVDGPDYDSGWQTVAGGEPEPLFGGAALQQAELPPLILGRVFLEPETFSKLRFEFRADGAGYFTDFQTTPPRTPNGYIDAEVLLSGPLFQAPFRAESLEISHEVQLVGGQRSLAGTSNPVVQARWRKVAADLVVLPTQTAHRLFEWLTRAGPAASFLLLVEPTQDDPPTARNTTMYASLDPGNFARGLRYGSDVEVDGQRCRSLGFEFVERI